MSTQLAHHYAPSLLGSRVFDDILGTFFNDVPTFVQRTTQGYPVVDIFQNDHGSTVMEFALAGFSRKDISIEVKPENRTITVSAKLTDETTLTDGGTQSSRRIARRDFAKTYVNYDDNLDLAKSSAKFENGLLIVEVPRRAETQPLSIEIK